MEQPATEAASSNEVANIAKIQHLLKAKDDTQRFVGLALLKSVLDNSPQLREDEQVVRSLWDSVPSRFLDRLLRTGSNPSNQNSKEMLDLVVSVLHTFAALLPEQSKGDAKLVERIPGLVGAVLYSSEETSTLLLQLLHTLVSSANGAQALVRVEDLSPLTETAPTHTIVLDILRFSWLNAMAVAEDSQALSTRIEETIQSLVSSFTGTDAVTLLEFLGSFLQQADSTNLSPKPRWLKAVVGYIQKLVTSRPAPEARYAYTNAAASLLRCYPSSAPELLFTDGKGDEKFAYLLINLMLIDIRSSAPTLLEQLNTPEYTKTSRRLASAFDVICIFVGYLVRSLEDESLETFFMPVDNLLKIRKGISDTMSVAIEYLRDRWDASVAGAMGLHPDARVGPAETLYGSRPTLAWDAIADTVENDPLILSAVRTLALWLREEENDLLRKEATGLIDMLLDLYQASSGSDKLDFRSSTLVALEALFTLDRGREIFQNHDGWRILGKDLTSILQNSSTPGHESDASRGIEIVRVLLQVVEQQYSGTEEEWMDLITTVAAWNVSGPAPMPVVLEFQVAALQLCCAVLAGASGGMRSRYGHSIRAINGIANLLSRGVERDSFVREPMEDVLATLSGFEQGG